MIATACKVIQSLLSWVHWTYMAFTSLYSYLNIIVWTGSCCRPTLKNCRRPCIHKAKAWWKRWTRYACFSSCVMRFVIAAIYVQQYGMHYLAWQHHCAALSSSLLWLNLCTLHITIWWISSHGWSMYVHQRKEWMLFEVLVHSFRKECQALLSLNICYNHFCGWPSFVHLLKEYSHDTSTFPSSLGSKCRWNLTTH